MFTLPDTIAILFTLFTCAAFGIAAWSAERRYRALPMLSDTNAHPSASVEVIIPARNESGNIQRVVGSLVKMDYPRYKVTVIDDQSTDNTAVEATSAGATVIRLTENPPPGWTGKCNACEQGAIRSTADWLLFTDADTYHTPESLREAVAYAEKHQLDALSLLLRQECETFWERVILPIAYQQFFSVLQPSKPAFNGQYILIKRAIYTTSGGFGAVRGRVMEDVAFAESLARQGYSVALINGHQSASVRMYQGLRPLLRGMTKTAFAAARDRGGLGLALGGLTFLGIFTMLLLSYGILTFSPLAIFGVSCIMFVNLIGLAAWHRRFGVSPIYGMFALLGIALLWWVGMVSTFRVLLGIGVRWKDRTIIEKR